MSDYNVWLKVQFIKKVEKIKYLGSIMQENEAIVEYIDSRIRCN